MKTLKNKLIPNFLKEYIIYYQENGFKKTIQKFGLKLIAIIIFFYLVCNLVFSKSLINFFLFNLSIIVLAQSIQNIFIFS